MTLSDSTPAGQWMALTTFLRRPTGTPNQTNCPGEKMTFLERSILLRIMISGWALDVCLCPGHLETCLGDVFQSLPGHPPDPPLDRLGLRSLGSPLGLCTSPHIWGHQAPLAPWFPLLCSQAPFLTFNPAWPLTFPLEPLQGTSGSGQGPPPPASPVALPRAPPFSPL